MGHIATEVIQRGGKASGVMPQFLKDIEMDHPLGRRLHLRADHG